MRLRRRRAPQLSWELTTYVFQSTAPTKKVIAMQVDRFPDSRGTGACASITWSEDGSERECLVTLKPIYTWPARD